MNETLLFFYGFLISIALTIGVASYLKASLKESKKNETNHSNYGCG